VPDNLGYLFAAFVVVWVGLFGYLILLSGQVKQLRDEVRLLREALERVREREDG
jgi:CcmD family protein